jgi:cleavage and polyadenylation specificity factor subunit 2
VLLSHSPSTYLSLYAYARARWGLTCPVYATQPTAEMGRIVCLAEAESWRSESQVFDPVPEPSAQNGEPSKPKQAATLALRGPFVPTVEEIHDAFDWIRTMRYNQPLNLGGTLFFSCCAPC